ncbi:hypothetical protein [Microbacterium sp. NPDC087868]|uniref:hypothetical protein n=1 Tax=Microbacterium sp. NPDC087868 TaxID=3364195 RepID=UPI00384D3358
MSSAVSQAVGDPAASGVVKSTLVGFNPGNIISDAVFTNKSTMTEAQIQAFFNSKVSRCLGGTDENGKPIVCLKDFKITSVTRPADQYCSGYSGAANESAARIIYRVSQACNINPQVLIVMLQKEQGLITHTWPSAWRYNIALGQGCPDTAPCDPNYIGFFHQIYGAARQMQIYMEGRWFQWYAPGKTWNILYNPNANCGSSPVYVANKATSALYYYTPYQPNAAALRAGYGTGDGCSAYGNRNFYNYFTDWFGSTQSASAPQGLVKVGTAVWLVSGQNRYHITAEAYPEYKAVLGAPKVTTASALTPYTVGARGSFYVKNASTGVVAMLQGSQTHRFASCALVASWGGSCGAPLVTMSNAHFSKFKVGSEMTSFARVASGGRIHQLSGNSLVPLFDAATAKARNAGVTPYAAVMPAAAVTQRKVETRIRFTPGTFIKESGKASVWLPDDAGVLHHLPSWPQAAELGLPSKVGATVSAADIKGYSATDPLSPFVQCGGVNYAAAGGTLHALGGAVPSGFTATRLDAITCGKLKLTGTKLSGTAVFVQFGGVGEVFHLINGQYRAVPTADQQKSINGEVAPSVLKTGAAWKAAVKIGAPYPGGGTLIRANGTSAVWLVDGASLVHLPNWAIAAEYGLPSKSTVVAPEAISGMAQRSALTPFATCAGGTYVAADGKLRAVAPGQLGGHSTTALSAQVCAGRTTGTAVDTPVIISDGSQTAVAVAGGFLILPDAASVTRAAAGAPVVTHTVNAGYINTLARAVVPGEGALVRASNESAVTLISGAVRLMIPNWGVAADLGVQPRYEIVAAQAVATRPADQTGIGIFVRCGQTDYIASGGTLIAVTTAALGGFVSTPLTAEACATLKTSAAAPLSTVLVTSAAGAVYSLAGGELVPWTGGTPTVKPLVLDDRTIAGLPKS